MPLPGKTFPVYWLEVTTWAGMDINACHYWGQIRTPTGEKIKIKYKLNAKQAKELNKRHDGFFWKAGDETEQFFSRKELETAAIRWILNQDIHTSTGVANGLHAFLFVGNHSNADPVQILAGPEGVYETAHQLFLKAEENNFWEGNDDTMKQICKKWDTFVSCWFRS